MICAIKGLARGGWRCVGDRDYDQVMLYHVPLVCEEPNTKFTLYPSTVVPERTVDQVVYKWKHNFDLKGKNSCPLHTFYTEVCDYNVILRAFRRKFGGNIEIVNNDRDVKMVTWTPYSDALMQPSKEESPASAPLDQQMLAILEAQIASVSNTLSSLQALKQQMTKAT